MPAPALRISHLDKSFGNTPALAGLTLEIAAGECFGLVGENGAGKTTLIKCALDFCDFGGGTIEIFGVPHRQTAARSRIAFLPERFIPIEPAPIPELWMDFIRRGQPALINSNVAEYVESIDPEFKPPAGEIPNSAAAMPLMLRGELRGVISLQDIDREDAFGESGYAPPADACQQHERRPGERPPLRRDPDLLKETEQRAAELAAVNTVSAALARELDLNALIHLVGEQTRALFRADIAYVALLDDTGTMINFVYTYGEDLTSIKYGEGLTNFSC